MELNGWTSPQMLRRYGASARSARARRSYDRIMTDQPRAITAKGHRGRDRHTQAATKDHRSPVSAARMLPNVYSHG
jgi:hypothetical protein